MWPVVIVVDGLLKIKSQRCGIGNMLMVKKAIFDLLVDGLDHRIEKFDVLHCSQRLDRGRKSLLAPQDHRFFIL